jgi:hypothetical protein
MAPKPAIVVTYDSVTAVQVPRSTSDVDPVSRKR